MNNLKNNILEEGLPVLYLCFFYMVFFTLYSLGGINGVFEIKTFMHWDAAWYYSVSDIGYYWNPEDQSNVAFFPLFPLLWKLLGLNSIGMAFFNAFMYAFTAIIFFKHFKFSVLEKLFLLSLPCLMFCYFAYGEALFFLFSTIMLIGFKKDKWSLIFIGLLGAGLTRSALVAFVPGILFILIMNFNKFDKKLIKFGLIMLSATFLSLALVLSFQYTYTGELFGAFQTHKHWGHHLGFPSFPLHTFNTHTTFTEIFSFCFGMLSGIELLILFLNKIQVLKNRDLTSIKNEHLFSLSYLFCVSTIVLFIQGGTLTSLNRYVLCVAFFWSAFEYFRGIDVRKTLFSIIVVVLCLSGLLTMSGVFNKLLDYLRVVVFLIPLTLPFFINDLKPKKYLFMISIVGCFILQLHFYHLMFRSMWVG